MSNPETQNSMLDQAIADAAKALTTHAVPSELRRAIRRRIEAEGAVRGFRWNSPVPLVCGVTALTALFLVVWTRFAVDPGVPAVAAARPKVTMTIESPRRDVGIAENVVVSRRPQSQPHASAAAVQLTEAAPLLVIASIAIDPLVDEMPPAGSNRELMALRIEPLSVAPLSVQ